MIISKIKNTLWFSDVRLSACFTFYSQNFTAKTATFPQVQLPKNMQSAIYIKCRILAALAHLPLYVVSGLCFFSFGRPKTRPTSSHKKHINPFHINWFLARSELDFYCLESFECFVFLAVSGSDKEENTYCCRKANFSKPKRTFPNASHLFIEYYCCNIFPSRNH